MSKPVAPPAELRGHSLEDEDEPAGWYDSDLSSAHSSCCNSTSQLVDCPQHGSESSGFRRTGPASCGRVSFHSIFGDSEEPVTSMSQESDAQATTVRNEVHRRRTLLCMEQVLFLYLTASALTRLNLVQMFRIKECLVVYNTTLANCRKLQFERLLHQGEINDLSNDLLAVRDALIYSFGAALALFSTQYLNKYGLRHLLFVCLWGTWITVALLSVGPFLIETPIYLCFIKIIPAVFTGGDIVMMTITTVHMANSSKENRLRWRFFIYGFLLLIPEIFSRLLDEYTYPIVSERALNGSPVILVLIAILISRRLSLGGITDHPFTQRLRIAFNLKKLQESLGCFTKQRDCKGRAQLIISILTFAVVSASSNVFSFLRKSFFLQVYGWDSLRFVSVTSAAMVGCFFVGIIVMMVLTKAVRPLDPLVTTIGFVCLALSHVAMAIGELNIIACYAALGLQLAPIIGVAYMRSHLCKLLESFELAPVFSVMCTFERVMPFVANLILKMVITQELLFGSHFFVAFVVSAGILALVSITYLYVYLTTRSRGYPTGHSRPVVNVRV